MDINTNGVDAFLFIPRRTGVELIKVLLLDTKAEKKSTISHKKYSMTLNGQKIIFNKKHLRLYIVRFFALYRQTKL